MELNNWIRNRLVEISKDLGLDGYTFECYNEQDDIKPDLSAKHICIVVKNLTATRVFTTLVQPIQLIVMSEENSLQIAQMLFEKLASLYNYYQIKEDTTAYKLQISNPAVMNNYNVVASGLRSMLYVGFTLIINENIADITTLQIDGNDINFITAQVTYGASMDTVQKPSSEIASSVKISGALNMSIVIPCQNTDLTTKALNIMFGVGGVNQYVVINEIKIGNVDVTNITMQIMQVAYGTAVNDVPSLVIGLVA